MSIKDKLPEDYHLPSQPLFYCEEDDSLHTTRQAASYRHHQCLRFKAGQRLEAAKRKAEEMLSGVRVFKTKILPQMQKTLNAINARLRELLDSKDWKATHSTHAAKRREILELRYRRMVIIGETKKEIEKLNGAKREYRDCKDYIEECKKKLEEAKAKQKEAEEFWKEHNKDKEA